MTLAVLADVTTPESLVASWLVDRLAEHGVEVAWRAVQGGSQHLVATRPLPVDDALADAERVRRLAATFGLELPEPWQYPTVLPANTPAIAALAEADCSGVLDSVRRRLYRAYWMDRLDVGSPELLRTLLSLHFLRGIQRPSPIGDFGYAVSIGGGPVTSLGWHRMRRWQEQWNDAGRPVLPAVARDDDEPVSGEDALRALADALPAAASGAGNDRREATLGAAVPERAGGTALALTTADPRLAAHERWLRGLQRRSWRWADPSVQLWWQRPDP